MIRGKIKILREPLSMTVTMSSFCTIAQRRVSTNFHVCILGLLIALWFWLLLQLWLLLRHYPTCLGQVALEVTRQ